MNALRNILVILTMFAAHSLQSQNVKVKCINRTGFKLDSLSINGEYIGTLKNDSSSRALQYKEIMIDSGTMPIMGIRAVMAHGPVGGRKSYECATSWKRVTNGYYTVYIYYYDQPEDGFLGLSLTDLVK